MRFAPFCLLQNPGGMSDKQVIDGSLEALTDAEAQGYDAAYFAEHFFSPYCLGSSLPTLAGALAMRTKKIRIGTAVTVLPLHQPLLLAGEWATVDLISDGRLELGIGRGYNWFEFDSLEIDIHENSGRFQESLDILKSAWTQDRFSYHGKYYNFDETAVLPKPIQQPHPPIWYASISPDSAPMVAKWGLGFGQGFGPNAKELKRRQDMWEETARSEGQTEEWISRTVYNTPVQKVVWVAETDAQAERELEAILKSQQAMTEQWAFPGWGYPGRSIPEESMEYRRRVDASRGDGGLEVFKQTHAVLVGSPETVVAQMKEMLEEYPFDYMLMYSGLGGSHPDDIKRCWRLFADKVMPHFK